MNRTEADRWVIGWVPVGPALEVNCGIAAVRAGLLALLVILALVLAGCASGIEVREQDEWHRAPKRGWLFTAMGTIYVPPGELVKYTKEPLGIGAAAVMVHERVHAERQLSAGGVVWSLAYGLNAAARWHEERLAYEAEIAELQKRGIAVGGSYWRQHFVDLVCDDTYRGMVSRADAEAWFDGLNVGKEK